MDPMDVDDFVDVPDTPDRLAKPVINKRSAFEEKNHSSSSRKCFEEVAEIQSLIINNGGGSRSMLAPKCTSSFVNLSCPIDSESPSTGDSTSSENNPLPVAGDCGIKRLSSHLPKCTSSSINSLYPNKSPGLSVAGSFSSKSPFLFPKKTPTFHGHDSIYSQQIETSSFNPKHHSSSFQDKNHVEPMQRSQHGHRFENAFLGGMPGSGRYQCSRRSGLLNEPSSSQENILTSGSKASEGGINMTGIISSTGHRQGSEIFESVQNKPGDNGSLCLDPIVSPRLNKQKRLVRNGCISPNNIAKSKQLARNGNNDVAHDNNVSLVSGGSPVTVDIREMVAEDDNSRSRKGKGVIIYPCTSKEPEVKNKRSSAFNEKAIEKSDCIRGADKCIQETDEWRSTRNQTRELNHPPSSCEEPSVMREIEGLRRGSQHHEKRISRREKGNIVATDDDKIEGANLLSSDHVSFLPVRQTVSHGRTRVGRLNGNPFAANKLIKRKKQGSTSNSLGECYRPVSDDSEVVFLSSSAGPSNSISNSGNEGNLRQTIEVDELFPDLRPSSQDEDARAMQVESDELLARELQEQLYNDLPVLGGGEVDAQIALALQHQVTSNHTSSSRISLISNLRRQAQSRPSSNLSRRGYQARTSTQGRITRTRSRFPGPSRTLLPTRGGTSLFPANMDVDMRMHILGALEAFSEMDVGTGILQTQRDFNENDYETLLALDENIDQHRGASNHQINGLPQSTVQGNNFDEACAICLETPTIGDTIRHLPCLHKFHKDCIDPWLRRKIYCPICKSSIT